MEFDFGALKVEFKNVRASRSFRMWFADRDTLRVTKPCYASEREALDFVRANAKWICSTRSAVPSRTSLADYLLANPSVWIFGDVYEVVAVPTRTKSAYVLRDDSARKILLMHRTGGAADSDIEGLFMDLASKSICSRVASVAEREGFEYSRISVRNQRGRWASRSSSGTVSFNWRLVLVPFELQDYVIYHEFAHSRFMDHSVSFWIYLSRLCPNAKALDRKISALSRGIFCVGS